MDLWSLFERLEEICDSNIHPPPVQSTLIIYDSEGWSDFVIKKGVQPGAGIFYPRELTAHVANLSESVLVSRIAHEYFGHGIFCEFNEVGREIVRLDRLAADYEKDLFGKILLPSERFIVPETPEGDEYLTIRSMMSDLEKEHNHLYEDFAKNVESTLSRFYFEKTNGGET